MTCDSLVCRYERLRCVAHTHVSMQKGGGARHTERMKTCRRVFAMRCQRTRRTSTARPSTAPGTSMLTPRSVVATSHARRRRIRSPGLLCDTSTTKMTPQGRGGRNARRVAGKDSCKRMRSAHCGGSLTTSKAGRPARRQAPGAPMRQEFRHTYQKSPLPDMCGGGDFCCASLSATPPALGFASAHE